MKSLRALWALFLLCALSAQATVSNNTFLARTTIPNDPPMGEVFGFFEKTSTDPGEPAHGNQPAATQTVWWTWTAPADGAFSLTAGSTLNERHVLAAYTGTQLSRLTAVAYDVSTNNLGSRLRFNVKAGVAYHIAAACFPDSPPPAASDKRLRIGYQFTPASAASNDPYAGRIELAGDFTTGLGVNTSASKEAGELNHAGNQGGRSLWWTWTSRRGPVLVTVSTKGSSTHDSSTGRNRPVDTLLGVYTAQSGPLGPVSTLTLLEAHASDDNADAESVHSEVKFHAPAEGRYAIAIDGFRDGSGTVDAGNLFLSVRVERSNGSFVDRAPITKPSAVITGTNIGLLHGATAPATGYRTVWWTWRAPANGTLKLSTAGSSFDTRLDVFTGTALANLVSVASSDDADPDATPPVLTSATEFAVTSGTNYQIAIGGKSSATGAIVLALDFVANFPAIVTQPVSQSVTVGSTATFSVVATGNPAPTYLWQRRPAGTKIWLPLEKETSSTLTLAELKRSAHGDSFRCDVSNPLGKVVSAIATLGVTPPAPTITLPDTLRIRGSVDLPSAPEDAPAELRYYARSLPSGLAMDPLTGRISGTLTKAGTFTVTYWSQDGAVKSALQKLTFVVLPVPAAMTGSFEGLLASSEDSLPAGKVSLKVTSGGTFTGTLITTDPKAHALKGVLALNDDFSAGSARLTLRRGAAVSYTLDLRISSDSVFSAELREGDALLATATDGARLPAYTTKNPSPGVGAYTTTLRASPLDESEARPHPLGTGYATAVIAPLGTLRLTGKLADGVRITASLPRGADAAYRLYLKPHKTAGNFFAGRLPFVARADEPTLQHATTNAVFWLKPASAKDAAYPAGFGPLSVAVSIEPWLKVTNLSTFLDLPASGSNRVFAVAINEGGLSNLPPNTRDLPSELLLTPSNVVLAPVPNPAAWSTKLNLATGAFTGSFRVQDPHPLTEATVRRTIRFEGVLQQLPADVTDAVLGRGFFLAPPVVKGDPALSGRVEFARPEPAVIEE